MFDISITTEYEPLPDLDKVVSEALGEGVDLIGEAIVEMMREPKTGNEYKSPQTGKLRVAAATGEAPGIDSETLVNSFKTDPDALETAAIYSEVWYAAELETELDHPFMNPAFERAFPAIGELISERVVAALND